ncbi:Crp/Fnr family transcriptional regulator [Azoarcus sp. L1K30]|nr:Crp/Fnr family transcriptional regulator [Azoarcus sp. L1K30]
MIADTVLPHVSTLSRIPPFDLLDSDEVSRLIEGRRLLQRCRGEIVAHCNVTAPCLWVVLEGEVKCSLISATGGEKIIQLAGAGAMFGEEAALLDRPQLFTAQATRNSVLLPIRGSALRAAMEVSAAFANAMTLRLSTSIYDLIENLQLCLQGSSTQRVAHYLSRLAPDSAQHCEIQLETDKQHIAAQLNLTPETLSRVLSRFMRDGMIRPHGRRGLVLDDLPQLRSCAAG